MTAIDAGALVDFTQRLVRIPSVFDPDRQLSEQPAADLVADVMTSCGWTADRDVVAPGRPNVVAVVEGGGGAGPTLMFEGHTDVVTEGDGWTVDPFGAEIVDGKLWGRGSADMKGGLAAAILATDALARRGPFPGRIVLAALVDEEGMMTGAKDFVARGRMVGVDGVVCCEPEGGEICHVAKGALRLQLGFTGKMAHGAMPFQGRNPNRAVATAIAALAGLEGDDPRTRRRAPAPRQGVDHTDRAPGGRADADERDARRRIGVGRRANDPRRGPRRTGGGDHRGRRHRLRRRRCHDHRRRARRPPRRCRRRGRPAGARRVGRPRRRRPRPRPGSVASPVRPTGRS